MCPTQNVVSNPHQSGPVVHWVDPAVKCFNIVLAAGESVRGTSSCCEAHPTPGCDTPSCEAAVCGSGSQSYDYVSTPNQTIPDNNPSGVSAQIHVADNFVIQDLNLDLGINHQFVGNLEIRVTSPGGTQLVYSHSCGAFQHILATADDDVSPISCFFLNQGPIDSVHFPPASLGGGAGPLSIFDGTNAQGTWVLQVKDTVPGNVGTLAQWSLHFVGTVSGPDPTCCNSQWDAKCVQLAQQVCGSLCESGCAPGVAIDPWVTSADPDEPTCHQFGSGPESPPIPADFFYPGSNPFVGTICLKNQPLGPTPFGEYGDADTLVRRLGDPFDRCQVPGPTQNTVPIELVALNLVSVQPIIVTGSQGPTPWNVLVNESDVASPQGGLTATKTQCNGGTWSSFLPVRARFTFTNANNPTKVLDTGLAGLPPIQLQLSPGHPWVHDLDPNLYLPGAECTNFHPGIADTVLKTECDCNVNLQRDLCDIEQGLSADCNQNSIPDECDPDFDFDTITDDCDNCPVASNAGQADADADTVGDACDLCPVMPRAFEGDEDGDRRPNLPNETSPPDNCPCVSNYDQADADGDGIGDVCDAEAGDVQGLRVAKAGANLALSWNPSCAAGDNDYAIYQGTIGSWYSHAAIDCTTAGATSETVTPGSGNRYLLVVPRKATVEGSYGRTSAGIERPVGTGACAVQALGCP